MLEWRNLVCGMMVAIAPASFSQTAADRALLHSNGGTWLNGSPAPETSAIFPDNLIQTQEGHTATIDSSGSIVVVQPETVVQFEGDQLVLDHGTLQLNTASQMSVRVNCIIAKPVLADRTQYDVMNVNGKVKVVAYRNDVKIHYPGNSAAKGGKRGQSFDVVVHAGEQATREERCGGPAKPSDGVDAKGAILNGFWAKSAAVAVVGTLACIGLCHTDDPLSPSKP